MNIKPKRAFLVLLPLLGFVLGCGSAQTEAKPDPAQASKPFPKAGGRQVP